MAKSTFALETPLREQLDRLAAFAPTNAPVLSLYLDARSDQNGQRTYEPFVRKTFTERARTFTDEARTSFDRDASRIGEYLSGQLKPSTKGVAIFACSAASLFEAVQLEVPIEAHWLFIGSVPHLYPLARVNDQHPRYAVLLVDTNSARIFVFGLGTAETRQQVSNVKTRKTSVGGWAQARYQRHVENFHLHHMKEVVDVLDRVVRDEKLTQVLVSCDEVTKPTLMQHLPKHLAEKIVDTVRLDINAPDREVIAQTLEVLRENDAGTDAARVQTMLDAWRAGGLGVAGVEDTMMALAMGQVEELLITATPELLARARSLPPNLVTPGPVEIDTSAPRAQANADLMKLADELVTKAQQSSARIRFVENPDLLAGVGGVGAILRFRI